MDTDICDTFHRRAVDQFDSSPPPHLSSSPFASSTDSYAKLGKPKKPPTVTPKRFTRFFTPRSSSCRSSPLNESSSGRQLRDITRNATNSGIRHARNSTISISFADIQAKKNDIEFSHYASPRKRKDASFGKNLHSNSSPRKRLRTCQLYQNTLSGSAATSNDALGAEQAHSFDGGGAAAQYIRRKPLCGINGRILQRAFGPYQSRLSHGRFNGAWYHETGNFYSSARDYHPLPRTALPFCTSSCNTNSLVAIGDEGGSIRLLETSTVAGHNLLPIHLTFRPHTNAVMDMAFSPDDTLLATASGDQTAQVIDMFSQRTKYVMNGHASSVKQVRFLPGNSNVLATSSRDGSVRLWDLRCKSSEGCVQEIQDGSCSVSVVEEPKLEKSASYVGTYDIISGAHSIRSGILPEARHVDLRHAAVKGEMKSPNRKGDVSVTALTFLREDRSHILLSASEASTCIKVWDIRSRHSNRRGGVAVPLSVTKQPESHTRHRQFGVNALALSGDSARVYALSRDSTVYAYSTNHLILGAGSEFSPTSKPRRHPNLGGSSAESTGPLYGFRHRKFQAATFYVKLALRPASTTSPEMLAVGSSDSCAVLFSTNECYQTPEPTSDSDSDSRHTLTQAANLDLQLGNRRPRTRTQVTAATSQRPSSRLLDTVPMHSTGTALVGGHQREVTSVSWTVDGELMTVSDDFSARCWREGEARARKLQNSGEGGAKLLQSGWAELDMSANDDTDDYD